MKAYNKKKKPKHEVRVNNQNDFNSRVYRNTKKVCFSSKYSDVKFKERFYPIGHKYYKDF